MFGALPIVAFFLEADDARARASELTEHKRELIAQREAVRALSARTEARVEVVDQLREAAGRALETLWTPEGLRHAMNTFDVEVGLRRVNGSRRMQVKGLVRLISPQPSTFLPQATSSGR